MRDHTGTHHIDGSQCLGDRFCTRTAADDEAYMANFKKQYQAKFPTPDALVKDVIDILNVQSGRKAFVPRGAKEDDPSFQPKGTTVLSCGCGIPWEPKHGRSKTSKKAQDPIVCGTHGIAVVDDYR